MKQIDKERQFEVILPPEDRLDEELRDVLGGCFSHDCDRLNCDFDDCTFFDCKHFNECPPGYVWDAVQCKCVPMV